MAEPLAVPPSPRGLLGWFLDAVEWAGNKLPDPVALFALVLAATWLLSAVLSNVTFTEIDPRTLAADPKPIVVKNQLTGAALATFLANMVRIFVGFPPLGLVLVALLGVGVADHTGFIGAGIKAILRITHPRLLTPMLIAVGIVSHTAADTGYILVVPVGGIIFHAAGRHPLAGIVAAFAAVAGGFSANFVPSGLDPLLQGFTESSARIIDPQYHVNPLCNYYFTTLSSLLIIGIGWYVTDRVIEPRLRNTPIDGDPAEMPRLDPLTAAEVRGLLAGLAAMGVGVGILAVWAWPADSPLRSPANGELTGAGAPLMQAIVPLIFLLFLIPGIVHGYVAGTVKGHRDVIAGMTKAMGTMNYYLVMAFFAALFTYAFAESNLGVLLAVKGAALLQWLRMPAAVTILGLILFTVLVNLLIGSASAKWALLGPIFVPMLMQLGLSPELTQAAYRIGDSTANILTPLLPYFPLVLMFCRRYTRGTGIGTLVALMVPYSLLFLIGWTLLLLVYWHLGLPLGLQAPYTYPPA